MKRPTTSLQRGVLSTLTALTLLAASGAGGDLASAQAGAVLLDPNLELRTAASGLVTPTSLAFLGQGDMLVLEKNTGRVQRVVNGVLVGPALDLAVNFASERGLLGIALHPSFPDQPRRLSVLDGEHNGG